MEERFPGGLQPAGQRLLDAVKARVEALNEGPRRRSRRTTASRRSSSSSRPGSTGYGSGSPDLQPGDLVYFYSDLHHVGIYIGDGKMIHAPRTGKNVEILPIDSMDGPVMGGTRH
ncbi:C40 family peptidase [Kitasatospora purpeofusca]|uniref:C40 family peptidase n=1 Tax=Kitasatospora purpeofusca TaxID=67352 RepID=UPI00382DE941